MFDSNRGRGKVQNSEGDHSPTQKRNNLFGRILEMSLGDIEVRDKKAAALLVMKQVSEGLQNAFHHYFTAVFYRALPASMLYYPAQKVVACDLNLLHYHLSNHKKPVTPLSVLAPLEKPPPDSSTVVAPALGAVASSVSSTENSFAQPESLIEGDSGHTGDSKRSSASGRGQMQRLFSLKEGTDSSKELGSRGFEPVHHTGPTDADLPACADKGTLPFQGTLDLEHAFSHLLVSSPAFFDLVKRHGPVLQHFRF